MSKTIKFKKDVLESYHSQLACHKNSIFEYIRFSNIGMNFNLKDLCQVSSEFTDLVYEVLKHLYSCNIGRCDIIGSNILIEELIRVGILDLSLGDCMIDLMNLRSLHKDAKVTNKNAIIYAFTEEYSNDMIAVVSAVGDIVNS